ncbi:unnamed protein product [Caenorhabditis sp. 36 PRJEB53466]|nr:unnamed protein product [Caenorhabditis sp. 36 PRJEB53466]
MDEWTYLDEVDVVAKWPAEHKKAVFEGGKWSERRDGFEALNQLIEQNPRLSTVSMTIYGELMDEIRKILDRESNIVVVTSTARTVELLAKGLRNKFAGFIGMVFPFLIKRAKDKKKNVRDAILAALGAVSDTTTSDRIQKDLVDWFAIPSPESKQTLLAFLFAYFCRQNAPDVPFVKAIAPLIVKSASESDVAVREKACQALGSLKRLMGDAVQAFLGPISTDNAKMEKIGQYEKEAVVEWTKLAAARSAGPSEPSGEKSEENGGSDDQPGPGASAQPGIDPWTLLDPEDVTKKLEKSVESQLSDKNWKERVAGLETLKKEVESVGRVEISERLFELMKILTRTVEKDVNVNAGTLAAQVLAAVALRSRYAFAPTANRSFSAVFDKLKDKKAVLREALNDLADVAATTTPLSAYAEAVIGGISSKNPQSRQQTALFLARFFAKNDAKTIEVEAVKVLAEHILKATNDADKEVREAAIRTVAALQKGLGESVAKRLMADVYEDKLKAEKIPPLIEELTKEFGASASPEMVRLSKHYNISTSSTSAPKKPSAPPARPVSAVKRVPPSQAAPRRAPSPAQRIQTAVAPALSAPRSFVARPAPNFGAQKPKVAVRPVVPVTSTTSTLKPVSRVSAMPRTTIAPGPSARSTPTPIAPNVVRNGNIRTSSSLPQKPIGIARPQTAIGTNSIAQRSRIGAPPTASGIVRPGSSGIPRAPSSSRIARPPSRPGSRNEIHHA